MCSSDLITAGIAEAGSALLAGSAGSVDDLASELMAGLAPDGGYEDDVALVLYRHPAPLDLAFAADSSQLAPVRAALRDWLRRCDLSQRTVQDVLVAAGEACANAVEHGHRNARGQQVRLRAAVTAGLLRLTVIDTGRWKAAQPGANPHRGHGIPLMKALMQQVTIEPDATGTTVDMQLRITT